MKRNPVSFSTPTYLQRTIVFGLIISLSSCSYFSRRSDDFDDTKTPESKAGKQTVSKAEYDALLTKYNQLSTKMKRSGGERISEELINELANSPKVELAETVDVFDSNQIRKKRVKHVPVVINDPSIMVSDRDVENQLAKLRRAEQLLEAGKYDEALSYIKRDVEKSSVKQIRVKAKFLLGELLLRQNEYDLAMQMFEEIITNYAFSGLVIKTLGRLIHCSEKLNLEDKKEKYFSMLNDIFGTG